MGKIKWNIDDCRRLAEEKGGKCLEKEYKNSKTKMLWECAEKHRWRTDRDHIYSGTWCPYCAKCKKHTIEYAISLAESMDGLCLSKEYKSIHEHLEWQCNNNHIWKATISNIIVGHWCPICNSKRPRYTLECCKEYAISKGGKCLSGYYKSAHDKLLWECDKKHSWYAMPTKIFNCHSWCPSCSNNAMNTIEDAVKLANKNKKISQHPEDVKYFIRIRYDEPLEKEYIMNRLRKEGIPLSE